MIKKCIYFVKIEKLKNYLPKNLFPFSRKSLQQSQRARTVIAIQNLSCLKKIILVQIAIFPFFYTTDIAIVNTDSINLDQTLVV